MYIFKVYSLISLTCVYTSEFITIIKDINISNTPKKFPAPLFIPLLLFLVPFPFPANP